MYNIVFKLDSNGHYSAYNPEPNSTSALYYGTDEDSDNKNFHLEDILANGTGVGKITIQFDVGTTNVDQISNLKFNSTYDTLSFNMWHHNQYGPLEFLLVRTQESLLPLMP